MRGTAGRQRYYLLSPSPLLALDVLAWFPGGLPIGSGDGGLLAFYYHPGFLLHVFSSTWNPYDITGLPAGRNLAQLPEALFFAAGRGLDLSYAAVQGVFYWLIQFVALLFMYRFLSHLLPEGNSRAVAAAFGFVLYTFRPPWSKTIGRQPS